jgi:glycosyltransferase involved in cell wall biosynthesis
VRLLKFVDAFGFGGTERHVADLARTLDAERFDLRLACFRRWGQFLPDLESRGVPIAEFPIHRLYAPATLRQQLRLAAFVRRSGAEIVHTYNFYANVFAVPAARLAGAPVVVASIRDTGAYVTPLQRRVQRAVCRLADGILVNADAVKQWLVGQGFRPGRIRVIRNGVDLGRFERPAVRSGRLRADLGLPADAPIVAVFCRLHHLKGLEYFLDAAAVLALRDARPRFLIVGDRFAGKNGGVIRETFYQRELEARARRLGIGDRVVFTGFRLDVPDLLAEIAVSVLPSLSEGLPNTVLEAMAAGVPVVATRVGGSPEIVEEGRTGLLVPPRDAAALAEAVGRLLTDPALAAALSGEARRRLATRFSLQAMARETERFYLELLETRRRRGEPGRPAGGRGMADGAALP